MTKPKDTADPNALFQKTTALFTSHQVFKDESVALFTKLSTAPGLKEHVFEMHSPFIEMPATETLPPAPIWAGPSFMTPGQVSLLHSTTSITDMIRAAEEERAREWSRIREELQMPRLVPAFSLPQAVFDGFNASFNASMHIPSPEARLADSINALLDRLDK